MGMWIVKNVGACGISCNLSRSFIEAIHNALRVACLVDYEAEEYNRQQVVVTEVCLLELCLINVHGHRA